MLRFKLYGYPVQVDFFFWIVLFILGGGAAQNINYQRVFIWITIAFVSILVHEIGHAGVMQHYGDKHVSIQLNGMGGLAIPSQRFTRWQDLLISSAGPLASVLLGCFGWVVFQWLPPNTSFSKEVAHTWLYVNFGWTVMNLLPILPMDGGRILLALMGPNHLKLAYLISLICCAAFGVYAISNGWIWGGLLAFLFGKGTFHRYQTADQVGASFWKEY
jgi:stage IV sporulation protein FB